MVMKICKDCSDPDSWCFFNQTSGLLDFRLPNLTALLLRTMLSKQKCSSVDAIGQVIPRLGLVYGILVQSRCPELNLVQRIMSMILTDSLCDIKVSVTIEQIIYSYL